ncbi:hypothetical protein B0H13DRAFT_1883202 [Mycena leptocephala]|nr:hypothetical protein B0H13DRAFT_1883202 [Mycena leptocephala]
MPSLHTRIEDAVQKAIGSSTTPTEHYIVKYGLRERLRNSLDTVVERYLNSGEIWLDVCFMHTLFLAPVAKRPLRHFNAVKMAVLSRNTCTRVMEQADSEFTSPNGRAMADALQIFVGAVFRHAGFGAVLSFFRAVFLPTIATANTANTTYNSDSPASALEMKMTTPNYKWGDVDGVKKYSAARALLISYPLKPSASAQSVSMEAQVKPNTQTQDGFETIGLRASLVTITSIVKEEFNAFVEAAFPSGVLALLSEALTAFATGFLSAFSPDASRGIKQKNMDSIDSEYDKDDEDTPSPWGQLGVARMSTRWKFNRYVSRAMPRITDVLLLNEACKDFDKGIPAHPGWLHVVTSPNSDFYHELFLRLRNEHCDHQDPISTLSTVPRNLGVCSVLRVALSGYLYSDALLLHYSAFSSHHLIFKVLWQSFTLSMLNSANSGPTSLANEPGSLKYPAKSQMFHKYRGRESVLPYYKILPADHSRSGHREHNFLPSS